MIGLGLAAWLLGAAGPAQARELAVLRVGVHRDAGTVAQIAADGAAGDCVPGPASVACPADGPVQFRWAGDPAWALVGDAVVAPGATGTAWVLPPDDARSDAIAQLLQPTPEVVRAHFVRTGDHAVAPPSPGMLTRLWSLAEHDDPLVRRAVLDATLPLVRHTGSDPFAPEAPPLLPPGLLLGFAADTDFRNRRRLAAVLREVRLTSVTPPWFADEVRAALVDLLDDRATVQRAAISSLSQSAWAGVVPAARAWGEAIERVRIPGPPGRAAAQTLARLATSLKPGPQVDPEAAVALCFEYQREKTWVVWTAWRAAVPFDRQRAEVLLRQTVGLSTRLLRHWADTDPEGLAAAVRAWEPAEPHSARFQIARTALSGTPNAALRAALDLTEAPAAQ